MKKTKKSDSTPEEEHLRRVRLREEKDLLSGIVGEKSFRHFLEKLLREIVPKAPLVPRLRKDKNRNLSFRYPLLHLSDWHFEEVVRSEAVFGLNEYGIDICCKRAYRVICAFLDWSTDIQASKRIAIPELHVALNGDFITGTLHGLERHSDAPNVVRAAIACGELLTAVALALAPHFGKITFHCTVGNHGRLPDDKRVPTKDPSRSWDYLAYMYAKCATKLTSHIEWDIPSAYAAIYEIAGYRIFQTHGNFISQSLGIVGYGMRRFASQLGANLAATGKPLNYCIFGHFHNANMSEFAGLRAFINPSLIGTQEYGILSSGSINRSAQECYLFDEDLGYVSTETLYGEGPGYPGKFEIQI